MVDFPIFYTGARAAPCLMLWIAADNRLILPAIGFITSSYQSLQKEYWTVPFQRGYSDPLKLELLPIWIRDSYITRSTIRLKG